ncbi:MULTISPECIES: hypothetical protein [Aliiglaciecola]|uniref:hypothetical protein n=1 Tax=Aliiglaciecola TaxID=1406885 RepID=UPI001C0A40A7|nr:MULTISPECIES: hypothetical protein [Aliiglaciecola]MBU2878720.1 hypothetical protein [Aliiglaciecola lipolytica]MDO6711383.1 hypothetical protein [Aliiglaciecola sp. 2_MG-2023]MDO6752168.1 hypothetical protein [Aliiglaciecola sp. 1_MG-2023]
MLNLGVSSTKFNFFEQDNKPIEERKKSILKSYSHLTTSQHENQIELAVLKAILTTEKKAVIAQCNKTGFSFTSVIQLLEKSLTCDTPMELYFSSKNEDLEIYNNVVSPLKEAFYIGLRTKDASELAEKVIQKKYTQWTDIEHAVVTNARHSNIEIPAHMLKRDQLELIACPPNSHEAFLNWYTKTAQEKDLPSISPTNKTKVNELVLVTNLCDNITRFPLPGGGAMLLNETENNNFSAHLIGMFYDKMDLSVKRQQVFRKTIKASIVGTSKSTGNAILTIGVIGVIGVIVVIAMTLLSIVSSMGGGVLRP